MKFTTLEAACRELRAMGAQFICPKDQFFGPLADAIEEMERQFRVLNRKIAHGCTDANCSTCDKAE